MSEFGPELARLMAERGVGVRQLARELFVSPGHVSSLRNGHSRPSPELAGQIDARLRAGGTLASLAAPPSEPPDEIAAIELARRAAASDVGDATCERLELAVDDLAVAYHRTPPAALLPRLRSHLSYVGGLLDRRATIAQRRRLLASGGWLSLLAATVLADLHDYPAAVAYARTAGQLGGEAGHREIGAWTLETRAWIALTQGDYPQAVRLARAAQDAASHGGSALIQGTAQEGRAHARLGDQRETRRALARVEALTSPIGNPDQPEHHYKYDPAKAEAYQATTLAWAGDPAAEGIARHVLAGFEAPASGPPRRRRAVAARLDLALALARNGKDDEGAGVALQAVTSGYLVPSHWWRAEMVVRATAGRGIPEAAELADAYRAEVSGRRTEDGDGPQAIA